MSKLKSLLLASVATAALLPCLASADDYPQCPTNIHFSSSPYDYDAFEDNEENMFDVAQIQSTHFQAKDWGVLVINVPAKNEDNAREIVAKNNPRNLSANPIEQIVDEDDDGNPIYGCLYSVQMNHAPHAFVVAVSEPIFETTAMQREKLSMMAR